jgi:putative ABC transport system permease protein
VLIVGVAFFDYLFNSNYPEIKKDRFLCVDKVVMYGSDNCGTSSMTGSLSTHFIENYIKSLNHIEKVGIATNLQVRSFYLKNKKLDVSYRFVDLAFFEVVDLHFISGCAFNKKDYDNCSPLAIISEGLAKKKFGSTEASISQQIIINEKVYKVKGVVRDVGQSMLNAYSDIWLPLSAEIHKKSNFHSGLIGSCQALIIAEQPKYLNAIKAQFHRKIKSISINDPQYSHVHARILTATEQILVNKFGAELIVTEKGCYENMSVSTGRFKWTLTFIIVLFILFSFLGLLNVNLNRAYERSSEIGVRRSFGSSKMMLIKHQFLEHFVFVLIGGVMSLAFSSLILLLIQKCELIPGSDLHISIFTLLWGLVFVFIFSFLSGLIPTYKLTKLNLVKSLKSDEL